SKYRSKFTYTSNAPLKELSAPIIEKMGDTILGQERRIEIAITPQRPVNRLEVFTNAVPIHKATINGVPISEYYLKNRRSVRLVTHYISNNEPTLLQMWLSKDAELELTIYEASNDLMEHSLFTIPSRSEELIPMPFVLNDAVIIKKTIVY
ncbi:MAG: peptidase M28, partial [Muriicola sp.]|nr:peptidase M28 [Muriicola sp.]